MNNISNSKAPFFFTSVLYILGAIFQSFWIHILYQYEEQVYQWLELPIIGWVMGFLFVIIIISTPILFFIGIKLFLDIKKADIITFSKEENKKRKMVNFLLLLGIAVDLVFGSFLIFGEITDRSAVPIFCAIFGGRILQANIMAIEYYFSVK